MSVKRFHIRMADRGKGTIAFMQEDAAGHYVNYGDYLALQSQVEALQADAERYRWLCDGHGYFMEEEMLCGHENEKDKADKAIDDARLPDATSGKQGNS